jgi:Zn-dependent protease with chaperone function
MTAPVRRDDPPVAPAARDVLPGRALPGSARSVTGRAALSLALLLGYYALAAGAVLGLAFLSVHVLVRPGGGFLGSKLAIFTVLVGLGIFRAALAVERRAGVDDASVPAPREEQPELWGLVDEVAAELRVAPPDDLRLRADVNAGVRQDTRLLGLRGGRRHMVLGVALLQVVTVEQLRGIVAHELGHYARGDTRLAALVHRAGGTMERTVMQLGPRSVLGRLFGRYAALFQRVSLSVRRRQELRADQAAVRVAGRAAHAAALRELQAAAAAWSFFWDAYVSPLWHGGTAPEDLYAGYRLLLTDPVRREQVQAAREDDGAPTDPLDSHPSLATRLADLQRLPDRYLAGDRRPARELLRAPEDVERRVTAAVNAQVLGALPEQQYYAFREELEPGPYTLGLDSGGSALSRATAAVDGLGQPAGLGRTLALIESGRDADLVTALTGDRRDLGPQARATELRHLVLDPLVLSAECALVDAGRARWRASWSEPVRLVDALDAPVDVAARLERVLGTSGPAGVRPALAELGVPLGDPASGPASEAADQLVQEHEDELLAVWPGLAGRRSRLDAYLTRDLLVLVRQPRTWRDDIARALGEVYGVGRRRLREATAERVDAVLREGLGQACRRPGAHVVRWDDIPAARLRGSLDKAWVLRLDGQPAPFHRLKAEDDGLVPGTRATAALLRQLLGARLLSRA